MKEMKVTLKLTYQPFGRFRCPVCDEECPTHDHRQLQWRHLDTCGYVTMIEAGVPRVDCLKHGVRHTHVQWAEPGARFTSLFETLMISWLKIAAFKSISEQMKITWEEAGQSHYNFNEINGVWRHQSRSGFQPLRGVWQCQGRSDKMLFLTLRSGWKPLLL